MMPMRTFALGDRVKMAGHCPIDFEGTGPLPGDLGRIVAVPERNDQEACLGIRFDRGPSPWLIPRRYLEIAD